MRSVFRRILLLLPLFVVNFIATSQNFVSVSDFNNELAKSIYSFSASEDVPVATDDTIYFCPNCGSESVSLNIMDNDSKSYADSFMVYIWKCPTKGLWSIKKNGDFIFTNTNNFQGTLNFTYKSYKIGYPDQAVEAQIIINIMTDTDCDGIMDEFDIDDDNDGIVDEEDGLMTDTDSDSIPNYLDIDSDNDGIPDNIEGQPENYYVAPLYSDIDKDGLDDAYDPDNGGSLFSLQDTDDDGMPDFLDLNSDNDEYSDLNEAYDADFDTIPEISCSHTDCDNDGLDDNFDTINGWLIATNSLGHNAPLPDYNKDGIRDWRDASSVKPIPGEQNPLQSFEGYFTIYPNPAQNFIRLNIPNEALENTVTLDFFTIKGELIFNTTLSLINNKINITNLHQGIYIVRINSANFNYMNRLVINR